MRGFPASAAFTGLAALAPTVLGAFTAFTALTAFAGLLCGCESGPPSASLAGAMPEHIVAGYYPNWPDAPPRLRDVNRHYNMLYLFAAQPVGGAPGSTGAVFWRPPGNGRGAAASFKADLQYARRAQGRKIMLSVGGDGNGMSFPNRAKSRVFLASVIQLIEQFGGIDGLDWNTFQAAQAPDTAEMIWISLELKRRYPGFIISAPPAPWNTLDMQACREMVRAGAMDYAAPQYYDGPNLADPAYMLASVRQWVALLGAGHVVVGFGVNSAANYMSGAQAQQTWRQIEAQHPGIRGAFDWEINTDEEQGWPFANGVGPLIRQTPATATPTPTPTRTQSQTQTQTSKG